MRNLTWSDLRSIGKTDNARRWYPSDEVAEYFVGYRRPTRAWPHSYAKAAQTAKFARWLEVSRPSVAARFAPDLYTLRLDTRV